MCNSKTSLLTCVTPSLIFKASQSEKTLDGYSDNINSAAKAHLLKLLNFLNTSLFR
jgi:hypothetical protein